MEGDVSLLELGDHVEEMADAPAQAIEAPDHQRVARAQVVQAGLELRALAQGAGAAVAEDPRALLPIERVELRSSTMRWPMRSSNGSTSSSARPYRTVLPCCRRFTSPVLCRAARCFEMFCCRGIELVSELLHLALSIALEMVEHADPQRLANQT